MHKSYDVYLGKAIVGEAGVSQEGLYYQFRCRCRLPSSPIYCAVVRSGDKEFSLGICVPDRNTFRADKRIPVKLFDKQDFQFYLVEKHRHPKQEVAVDSKSPFQYLEYLANAYFNPANRTVQIGEPEVKDAAPSQRGSDLNP